MDFTLFCPVCEFECSVEVRTSHAGEYDGIGRVYADCGHDAAILAEAERRDDEVAEAYAEHVQQGREEGYIR